MDSLLGALAANIAETCRDALAGGEHAVLAVPDDWSEDKIKEFKDIVQHVTKVLLLHFQVDLFLREFLKRFSSTVRYRNFAP